MNKLDVVLCPNCQTEWYEDMLLRIEDGEKVYTLRSILENEECPSCDGFAADDFGFEEEEEDDYSEKYFYYDLDV